jgi:hypothetical protein
MPCWQRATHSNRSATRWRTCGLLGLAFIVLGLALALPVGARACSSGGGGWTLRSAPLPTVAQGKLPASVKPTPARAPSGAPMRRVGHARPGFGGRLGGSIVTSGNWAGYDVTGGGFSSVSASWVQPAIQADDSTDSLASFWVGLDGDGSNTVEQLGTQAENDYGSVSYQAWWEMYPADEVLIPGMTITPGDTMTASVTTEGNGYFTLSMSDETTGDSYHSTPYSADAQDYSAEVIAEAPTDAVTDTEYPLADFGTVYFTNCAIDGLPISDFDWNQIDMADSDSGATLASTSALGADGASFAVAAGDVTPTSPATSTAPITAVTGADASWHKSPVTLTFTATDPGGPGVKYTDYSIDGGGWTPGTSLTIPAPTNHANDGTHTIRYSSTNNDGNVEPVQTCQVKIDTLGPVCAAQNATVKHGKACRLYFKVHDRLSPKVTTVLAIQTKSGVVKKRFSWGYGENFAGWWWKSYTCRLPRGTYDIRVYGKDLAGNAQSVVGKARLRVT